MTEILKGTSVLVSLPTLLYVGLAQRKNRVGLLRSIKGTMGVKLENFLSIPYEFLPLAISLVYGAAYRLARCETDEEPPEKRSRVLLIGAVTGLSLSVVGRFGMDLPIKMFGMPPEKAYMVHIVAPILYVAIFLYVSLLMNLK